MGVLVFMVEVTGRMIVEGKRGAIPGHLVPVLERLELNAAAWSGTVEAYGSLFLRMAGSRARLAERAKAMGRKWFCRARGAEKVYAPEAVTA